MKKQVNKKVIIIIVILSMILIPLIYYKTILVRSIDVDKETLSIINKFKNAKTVSITKKDYEGDYLKYKNIKIGDSFKDYYLSDISINGVAYLASDSYFYMGTTDSKVENLKKSYVYCVDCKKTSIKLIKDNDIKNDTDLFKFLGTYNLKNHNLFTPIKKLKQDLVIFENILMEYPTFSKIEYINGDFNGYILSIRKGYEVVLEKDNKNYIFDFANKNNSYTEEQIYDFISTIVIE